MTRNALMYFSLLGYAFAFHGLSGFPISGLAAMAFAYWAGKYKKADEMQSNT